MADESGVISDEDIERVLRESDLMTQVIMDKTVVMGCTLPNGFEIVTSASCVRPGDLDREVGERVCFSDLKDKVGDYLGFLAHEVEDPVAQILDTDEGPTPR